MAVYTYEGISKDGKKIKGKIEADTRREALVKLKEKNIIPLEIEEYTYKKPFWKREIWSRKPSEEELAFVLTQISTLLRSAVPLPKALELVASQTEDERISSALITIKSEIEGGKHIWEAFQEAEIFPEFLSEMLKTAETGENLEYVFEMASEFLEFISEIRSKIISSVAYPSVVIGFSILALFITIEFVIPKISSILLSFGKDLPLITKVVIALSKVFKLLLFLSPLALIFLFIFRRRYGREKFDSFMLKLPVVGRIILYFNISRFARVMYMMMRAGTPITKTVRLSVGSVTNRSIRSKFAGAEERIAKGESLAKVLRDTGIFPPLFVNLVETGEASGELERMLNLLSEVYKKEAIRQINLWVRMIEPLSMLIIGTVVAIIVMSVILPITEISAGVK